MQLDAPARRGPKPKHGVRDNLVEAGLKLFHAEGYAATGIQSIVEGAGVPKGSFYNHFASKEAFGAEVIDAYSDRGLNRLRNFLSDPNLAPLARLEAYFDDRIEAFKAANFARGCVFGNFSAEAADHSLLIREHLAEQFDAWSRVFETCIADAQAAGAIGDRFPASTLAKFIFNSWEGALLRMRADKSAAPLTEFKEIVFRRILT